MQMSRHNLTCLLSALIVAGPLLAQADVAQAGKRTGAIVGAGAAGLAIGLIAGGMASQSRADDTRAPTSAHSRTDRKRESRVRREVENASVVPKMSSEEIEIVQENLNLLGYQAGDVDGSLGPQTTRAINKFLLDNDLPQSGRMSAAEQKLLAMAVEKKKGQVAPVDSVSSTEVTGSRGATSENVSPAGQSIVVPEARVSPSSFTVANPNPGGQTIPRDSSSSQQGSQAEPPASGANSKTCQRFLPAVGVMVTVPCND